MKVTTPINVLPGAEGFFLQGSDIGVMLIHGGGGGSASDMRELGQFIFEKLGYSVYAPLLPGYGTTKEDLAKIQLDDWLTAVKEGFKELKSEMQKVFVIGHSMGGVLALYVAGEFADDVAAVVSICAPTRIKGLLIKFVPFFNIFIKYWKQNDVEEFQRVSNGLWVGYEKVPLNMVAKFKRLMKLNNSRLSKIVAPILLIHATNDEFVPQDSPKLIYEQVSSSQKTIEYIESDHAILFSQRKMELFTLIQEFLKKR